MTGYAYTKGGAVIAALLLSLLLVLAGCGAEQGASEGGSQEAAQGWSSAPETTNSGEQVEAVTPEEILSEEERTGFEEPEGWETETDAQARQIETGTSAGAVPAVAPFNFGRDPGGPEDKTLYLTIPKLGLNGVPAFDSTSEEKLEQGVIHVPATGFPWQQGANTYIAGHRIGYPGTGSDRIFYDLDELTAGDEVTVTDAAGEEYVYRISGEPRVVGPQNVQVMNPPEDGSSILTLQTCTLPDYEERIVVQGELVEGETTQS